MGVGMGPYNLICRNLMRITLPAESLKTGPFAGPWNTRPFRTFCNPEGLLGFGNVQGFFVVYVWKG